MDEKRLLCPHCENEDTFYDFEVKSVTNYEISFSIMCQTCYALSELTITSESNNATGIWRITETLK